MTNSVVWIMGLSGSGKTTTALALVDTLRLQGNAVVHLDGDELRTALDRSGNFSKDKRIELALTYGKLAQLIYDQGFTVVVSSIGLYGVLQSWLRSNIQSYLEVFLDAPLELLFKRDFKGIYKMDNGSTRDFVMGVDIEPEFPRNPDVHIHLNEEMTAKNCVEDILKSLNSLAKQDR